MSEHVNGESKGPEPTSAVPPPAVEQPLDRDEVNGRLQELTELNAALMSRCASLRGQVARLTRELASFRT